MTSTGNPIQKRILTRNHDRAGFDCGNDALNRFLRQQARQANDRHLTRTTVLIEPAQPTRILAFYSTAPCEISVHEADALPGLAGYPHPVPFLRMTRLATDLRCRGQGFGELALVSAIKDAARIHREATALYGLLVDAKDDSAAAFYRHFGLQLIDDSALALYLPIRDCLAL
ncbi:MAG: hypothetical protein LAT61_00035 [Alcanivorax sp.]|nr:hypothetical protein [Alcanivorax sp.]